MHAIASPRFVTFLENTGFRVAFHLPGMTKDYWIPWSPGIHPAKSQGMTENVG